MTRVVVYFKNATIPISFRMHVGISQVKNDLLRLMRANEYFSVVTENGAIILQSEAIAGIYAEKD